MPEKHVLNRALPVHVVSLGRMIAGWGIIQLMFGIPIMHHASLRIQKFMIQLVLVVRRLEIEAELHQALLHLIPAQRR